MDTADAAKRHEEAACCMALHIIELLSLVTCFFHRLQQRRRRTFQVALQPSAAFIGWGPPSSQTLSWTYGKRFLRPRAAYAVT